MNDLLLDAKPRTLAELHFYVSMQPCPSCGAHSLASEKYGMYQFEREPHQDFMTYRCQACQGGVRYIFPAVERTIWRFPDGQIAGPEPSTLVPAQMWWEELLRLREVLDVPPSVSDYAAYETAWDKLWRAWTCARELLKFIAAAESNHEALAAGAGGTGTSIEWGEVPVLHARTAVAVEAYRAARPRYEALKAAHEAANPPPRPPAFSKASLEAHRLWARSPEKGPAVGQQLVAEDVAQPGARLGAQDLSGSIVTRAELTGADLSSADVHAVRWTDVDLSRARLGSALLHSSKLVRCRFTSAGLGLVSLGDSILEDCDFSGADLNRSTWFRADVARCRFDGARIGDARFDHAVVVDSSFRGASFATTFDKVYGTAPRAWFIRCDLREVDWTGRWFYETVFIDCLFGGGHGTPHGFQNIHLIRCALEPGGAPFDVPDLVAMLGLPAEHLIDQPDKKPRANERPYTRHGVDAKGPYTRYTEEHSPLLLAERARDARAPFPVPFNIP